MAILGKDLIVLLLYQTKVIPYVYTNLLKMLIGSFKLVIYNVDRSYAT